MEMIGFNKAALALALGLATALSASPVLAKSRAEPPGYAARAQASGADLGGLATNNRASALRDCNEKAASLRDYTWGDQQSDLYRACMAERGQAE
jgi:hypothetical protein